MKSHTDWLASRIETVPALASATYVTLAVNADGSPISLPYVVIHPADGTDDSDRLAGPSVTQHPRFTIHSVGSTYEQAVWAAEKVKGVLVVGGIGVTPAITGEYTGAVWCSSPTSVQTDNEAVPPYCYHTAEVGFESTPTA